MFATFNDGMPPGAVRRGILSGSRRVNRAFPAGEGMAGEEAGRGYCSEDLVADCRSDEVLVLRALEFDDGAVCGIAGLLQFSRSPAGISDPGQDTDARQTNVSVESRRCS
jgi:hypothetical protein